MVPYHRGRAETEPPASLLQPPTHVDIVASYAVLRIEPTDRLESSFADRQITAWEVICLSIRDEDMDGIARCVIHPISHKSIAGRGDVGAAHGNIVCAHEGGGE